jgi:aryl-alcohol dehydrogenase-like predicted oxidoreductase
MKLGLGTVQFGIDYGVSNQLGQTTPDEVAKILEYAGGQQIRYLDTAPAYGSSERVLGDILGSSDRFRIVTKTDKISKPKIGADDVNLAVDTFRSSLDRLGCQSVYGLLVHHPDDLLNTGGDRLMAELKSLQAQKLVEKIGVSVYDRDQIDRLLDKYSLDLIQIPLNVFDRRLLVDDYLQHLGSLQIEIHARSVFLQGVLLMSATDLPPYLARFAPILAKYHRANTERGVSSLQAAIGFVDRIAAVDTILVGINNLSQLQEIVAATVKSVDLGYLEDFGIDDETLVNPSLWRS